MKRIILSLIIISISYCSYDSCSEESDYTKCELHQITEETGFSCYIGYLKNREHRGCIPFPEDSNTQKNYIKIMNGMTKEFYSCEPKYEKDLYTDEYYSYSNANFEKESYSKGEEIIFDTGNLPENEKKIMQGIKTCSYLFYGKFLDELKQISTDYSNYKGYENIQDKTICFNAEQFPDLKDLIDCGYAEIKYTKNDKEYHIKTCFHIPNDKMPESLLHIFKTNFIDFELELAGEIFDKIEEYDELSKNQINSRRLSSTSIEVIVEDKNGKKVKYTDISDNIELISNGSEKSKEEPKGTEKSKEEPKGSENSNNSNFFKLNILLFSLILFNF